MRARSSYNAALVQRCYHKSATVPAEGAASYSARDSAYDSNSGLHGTVLDCGIPVHTFEDFAPVATLGVYVRAGSAHETGPGLAHYYRRLAFNKTAHMTEFRKLREVERLGANLKATTQREYTALTSSFNRNSISTVAEVLMESSLVPLFRHWEVNDVRNIVKMDTLTAGADPYVTVMEALHSAAFSGGLANSLYAPESQIGSVSSGDMAEFFRTRFGPKNMMVVGTGVNHEDVVQYVRDFVTAYVPADAFTAGPAVSESKYRGGLESRIHAPGNTFAAVAWEGAAADASDEFAFQVLEHLIGGSTSSVPYGSSASLLNDAIGTSGADVTGSGFSLSYSSTGMFGVFVAGRDAGKGVSQATELLRKIAKGDFSDEHLARANAQWHMWGQLRDEGVAGLAACMARCAVRGKSPKHDDFTAISKAAVQAAAAKALKSKPTLVVRGDPTGVPLVESL